MKMKVQELISGNRFKVNKECVHFFDEMSSHHYIDKTTGDLDNLTPKIAKVNDHLINAVEEAITGVIQTYGEEEKVVNLKVEYGKERESASSKGFDSVNLEDRNDFYEKNLAREDSYGTF